MVRSCYQMDRFRHVNHWNLVPGHSEWYQEDSTGKRGHARRVRNSELPFSRPSAVSGRV